MPKRLDEERSKATSLRDRVSTRDGRQAKVHILAVEAVVATGSTEWSGKVCVRSPTPTDRLDEHAAPRVQRGTQMSFIPTGTIADAVRPYQVS